MHHPFRDCILPTRLPSQRNPSPMAQMGYVLHVYNWLNIGASPSDCKSFKSPTRPAPQCLFWYHFQFIATNVAGRTKRTVVLSVVFVAYCAGSAAGAQIFQAVSLFLASWLAFSGASANHYTDRMMLLVIFERLKSSVVSTSRNWQSWHRGGRTMLLKTEREISCKLLEVLAKRNE